MRVSLLSLRPFSPAHPLCLVLGRVQPPDLRREPRCIRPLDGTAGDARLTTRGQHGAHPHQHQQRPRAQGAETKINLL
mgnify:CR=1 FL=1